MHTHLRGCCRKACKKLEHEKSTISTSQPCRGWFWLDLYQFKSESHYIYITIHLPVERPGAFCRLRLLSSRCNPTKKCSLSSADSLQLLIYSSWQEEETEWGWQGWNWAGWLSGEECLEFVATSLLIKTLTILSPSSELLHECTGLGTVFQPKSRNAWRFGLANEFCTHLPN